MDTNKIKQYFWIVLTIFVGLLALNLLLFVMPTIKRFGDSLYPVRNLTVSAEGKTIVSPDIATTNFSVVSRGREPRAITEENNRIVSAAIEFVKSLGIEAKDIRTSGYNLSPDYEYDEVRRRSIIIGYTLTQTVTVKIRDLAKVAEVIGGLPPLGVNQIGGINFTVDDPDKFLTEARAEAFAKARAKAAEIAKASGVRLGRVVNVSEFGGAPPIPFYGRFAEAGGFGGDKAVPPPTIEPGSEELRVQVSITYSLR